jgi:hypothetical protein
MLSSSAVLSKAQRKKQDSKHREQGEAESEGMEGKFLNDVAAHRRELHRQAAMKLSEVSKRFERSRSLTALAKKMEHQNMGIKKNLNAKKASRFRAGVQARSR